jgi:hypothetical protein
MRFSFEIVGVTRSQVRNLNLKPIDPANLSTFATSSLYDLKELISACDPAILGAMPEQTLFIYALEILTSIANINNMPDASHYRVVAPDFTNPFDLVKNSASIVFTQSLAVIVARIVEIQAVVPDMQILESSTNYCQDGLGLGLSLKLVDPAGGETKTSIPFPVWLPPPFLGVKMEWDESRGTVGFQELPPGGDPVNIANFLGKKAVPKDTHPVPTEDELARCTDTPGGQLRWYGVGDGVMTLKKMLGIGTSADPNLYPAAPQGQLALALPREAEPKLAELRRAGRWLYNECDVWTDDNFHVRLPKEAGYLVVWRDNLPSRPVQCMDPQKYLHDLLVGLAKRLWGTVGASSDKEITIAVPIGQVINLAVQRLQDAVNNELVSLIGTTGLNIQFAFLTSPYTDNQNAASGFDEDRLTGTDPQLLKSIGSSLDSLLFQDGFEPGRGGQSIDLRYQPHVVQEGSPDPAWCAFAVQLLVDISGKVTFHGIEIDLNDLPPMAIGPRVIFIPEPLRIPTLAVFFWNAYFEGAPLVMLPANSGLFDPDIHFDANSPGDLNQIRNTVVSKLNDLYNMLKLVQVFWSDESFNMIVTVLGKVVSVGRVVVDTTGKIENLSETVVEKHWYGDSNFNDAISSLVLIGPPHRFSHTVIKCYQHSMRKDDLGLCLRLKLPGNQFIAAIPSFRRLLEKFVFKNPIPGRTDITVELPYGDPPYNLPSTGIIDINDLITGIEFTIEA